MTETPISQDPRYRARPTIRVDDEAREAVTNRVTAFRVVERVHGLSALEMRFSNERGNEPQARDVNVFEDERDLALGSRILIASGDEQHPGEIFRGVVSAMEAEFSDDGLRELVVLAEDALQGARLTRRTRIHDNLRLSSLAESIARDLSLAPRITGFSESIGTDVQLNESDLAFLRRLLDRYDGEIQVAGDQLYVSPRSQVRRDTVTLELARQLRRARFRADLADQITEITTAGWDTDRGQRVTGTSSGANLGPGSGRPGADILRDKLRPRSEHVGQPVVTTSGEARALADAAFDLRARRFVRLQGTAEGNARIRVGTHVRVTGTSRRFDNTYHVVYACHRFDLDRGYETDFEAECAFLGRP